MHAQKGVTYQSLKDKESSFAYRIKKDIPRTFPDNNFFKENEKERQRNLLNILLAYSNFDPEVGYTQGMNFLVATLIYHVHLEQIEKDYFVIDNDFEEDVFWIFVYIMDNK
mmetsp:Transcript_26703/g.23657  ORF Transcript_26703/g.23657 Transcript_26703/m.23657 type:complete len:111 (+) Transcript_26703:421-753(+)